MTRRLLLAILVALFLPAASTPTPPRARDFNGDGKSDILLRKSDGANHVWHLEGLSVSSQGSLPSVDPGWSVAGIGDYDGDGKADILWRNAAGNNYVWLLEGAAIKAQGSLPTIDTTWRVAGIGDFNGDGRSDILWRKSAGANWVWQMDGVSVASQGQVPAVATDWDVAGIADFNGDGKGDILWRRTTGALYVWLVDGSVITLGNLSILGDGSLPALDASWNVVATGDYNGDGKGDVFLRKSDGTNYLWHLNGAAIANYAVPLVSGGVLPSMDAPWTVAGQGDYDGDGKSDVLWRKTDGTLYLWTIDGASITGGVIRVKAHGLLPAVDATWGVPNPR